MPIRKQNRKKIKHLNQQIDLDVPQELIDSAKELLSELILAKRKERLNQEIQHSKISRFLIWMKDNATALATIVTMLSAIWTVNQYFIQKSQSEKFQRQTLIAQFAGDLSDKAKRNSAVYALANLAGEDAVPLIASELKQNALFENDISYQNAISQSLITIGKPALDAVLSINREEANAGGGFFDDESSKIILATQPVISYFMINKVETFQESQKIIQTNKILLEGIVIKQASLGYADFSGVNFSRVWMIEAGSCRANFENSNLQDSHFIHSSMGNNNFDNAVITNTTFYDSDLENSSFNKITASQADFSDAYLKSSSWISANIKISDFSSTDLTYAKFGNATISNTNFQFVKSREVDFNNATLTASDFTYANLEDAIFSDADLMGVKFFLNQDDMPYSLAEAMDQHAPNKSGAFVRNADFSNAKNIDKQTQIYLCTWGAINVPGGCAGIEKKDTSALRKPSGTSAGSCF